MSTVGLSRHSDEKSMKVRRIRLPNQPDLVRQIQVGDVWKNYEGPWPFDWSTDLAPYPGTVGEELALPFQPLSFRDFMLYERHAIDAARGYARRFLPGAHRIATAVERITRRPFFAFKPKPLWYRQPIYYMSNHTAFAPSGSSVRAPSYTKALDYELELGFVLNRSLFNPTMEEAVGSIGALVVLCDFSARDVQLAEMKSGFGLQKAKHFMTSMSAEALVLDPGQSSNTDFSASVTINGKVVSRCSTREMRYSLAEVLVHAGTGEPLHAGELFGTGTLPGGSGMETGNWLQSGDELLLRIDGIGTIAHSIR
jgi:2-keto-4-pentenoate hydratase/2-oxohepta-3-ene-1,7-dioic acid hydratase in catechol pathway